MKNIEDAKILASTMKQIGKLAGVETVCVLTDMDEPLGLAVGNSLEVIEAAQILQGKEIPDIKEVVLEIGSYIISLAGKGDNLEQNKEQILKVIKEKAAYDKFLELVKNQGGDISYLEHTEKFEKAKYVLEIKAKEEGYIQRIDAGIIGNICLHLGAGRIRKENKIDPAARNCAK